MCAILFCISSWHVSRCTFQIFPWNLIRRRQSSPSQTCWSSTIVLNAKDGVRAIKINDDQVLQKAPVLFKRESLFQQHGPVLSHDLGLSDYTCWCCGCPKTWVDDIFCRKFGGTDHRNVPTQNSCFVAAWFFSPSAALNFYASKVLRDGAQAWSICLLLCRVCPGKLFIMYHRLRRDSVTRFE